MDADPACWRGTERSESETCERGPSSSSSWCACGAVPVLSDSTLRTQLRLLADPQHQLEPKPSFTRVTSESDSMYFIHRSPPPPPRLLALPVSKIQKCMPGLGPGHRAPPAGPGRPPARDRQCQ
eukprot:1148402-Rhodomonas_salina.1